MCLTSCAVVGDCVRAETGPGGVNGETVRLVLADGGSFSSELCTFLVAVRTPTIVIALCGCKGNSQI